jgi:hypothetical protein
MNKIWKSIFSIVILSLAIVFVSVYLSISRLDREIGKLEKDYSDAGIPLSVSPQLIAYKFGQMSPDSVGRKLQSVRTLLSNDLNYSLGREVLSRRGLPVTIIRSQVEKKNIDEREAHRVVQIYQNRKFDSSMPMDYVEYDQTASSHYYENLIGCLAVLAVKYCIGGNSSAALNYLEISLKIWRAYVQYACIRSIRGVDAVVTSLSGSVQIVISIDRSLAPKISEIVSLVTPENLAKGEISSKMEFDFYRNVEIARNYDGPGLDRPNLLHPLAEFFKQSPWEVTPIPRNPSYTPKSLAMRQFYLATLKSYLEPMKSWRKNRVEDRKDLQFMYLKISSEMAQQTPNWLFGSRVADIHSRSKFAVPSSADYSSWRRQLRLSAIP